MELASTVAASNAVPHRPTVAASNAVPHRPQTLEPVRYRQFTPPSVWCSSPYDTIWCSTPLPTAELVATTRSNSNKRPEEVAPAKAPFIGPIHEVAPAKARDMGADVVIAVDVGTKLAGKDEINNAIAIVYQMSGLLHLYLLFYTRDLDKLSHSYGYQSDLIPLKNDLIVKLSLSNYEFYL